MLHRISTPILAFAALVGSTAGRADAQTTPAPAPNDRARAMTEAGTPARWHAMLRPTQRSARTAPTVRNKTTGTVFVAEAGHERIRVRLTVLTTYYDGSTLLWAIIPGRCGSNMPPVAPVSRFPIVNIGNDGRAEMDVELALALIASAQYHVNVYRGGTEYHHVLTCGNLTKARQ